MVPIEKMTELDSTPVLDAEEQRFLTLINEYRAQNGAGPLEVSAALTRAADWMSNDMAINKYVSHTDSTGRDPFVRMADFNYPTSGAYLGENIAAGVETAQAALDGWKCECDPGVPEKELVPCDPNAPKNCTYAHRVNMLNPNYKVIGLRRIYNPASEYLWYWTTDFGSEVDETIPLTSILAARRSPRYRPAQTRILAANLKPKYLAISISPQTASWLRTWGWLILILIILLILLIWWLSKRSSSVSPPSSPRY